mmetsp:Transcript_71844/g.208166  ORF Transcript_71844/g.208166 Transcript_71844/m.208166 type:complete len:268 (+) Transcript_71844:73-876(+)
MSFGAGAVHAEPLPAEVSLPRELLLRKCVSDPGTAGPMTEMSSTVEPSSVISSVDGTEVIERGFGTELFGNFAWEVAADIGAGSMNKDAELQVAPSTREAVAAPSHQDLEWVRDAPAHGPFPDMRVAALVRQARRLSDEAFDEDALREVTRKSGWKLSLLTDRDHKVLCGFIISKIKGDALSIYKIAVPAAFRGRGFGRYIMEDTMKAAKKQSGVYDVCLSSLPTAVSFYQRLGFKAFRQVKITSDAELVEGQVYMEKRLRFRARRR